MALAQRAGLADLVALRTGDIWPQPAIEYAEETGDIDDDEERWLRVECQGTP